jgi:hypothetical protein
MTDTPATPTGDNEDVIPKADYDSLQQDKERLEKDLEDVRMEVLTPEYQKFLDSLEKSGGADDKKGSEKLPPADKGGDDEFEKLSKRELFDRAVKQAEANIRGELTQKEEISKKEADLRTKREIAAFAKENPDFETFRPIMYGLSLDPKNADLSISQLYEKSKEHVKRLGGGVDTKTKERINRSSSEKPGGSSSSVEKLKSMSNDEIAKEALAEMEAAGITLDSIE